MTETTADFVRALDLHKRRIKLLQEALCECPHRKFFTASLHDETCPVYVATMPEREPPTRICARCGNPSVAAFGGGWKCRDCGTELDAGPDAGGES